MGIFYVDPVNATGRDRVPHNAGEPPPASRSSHRLDYSAGLACASLLCCEATKVGVDSIYHSEPEPDMVDYQLGVRFQAMGRVPSGS